MSRIYVCLQSSQFKSKTTNYFKMPSVKYYRSVLPRDLLLIVGDYAGDELYKLVFTFTPKRRFLSNILMCWRNTDMYCQPSNVVSILRTDYWKPVRLDCIAEILTLLGEKCKLPENILVPSLKRISDILLEVHDYKLRRKVRKVW